MRRLILLRHAKSDWSAAGQRDIDRPLAARGRIAAPLVGKYLANEGLVPDHVLVSAARRTRETWELLVPALPVQPRFVYEPRLYEAGWRDLLALIQETPATVHLLMVVGHNPGMQDIALRLTGGGAAEACRQVEEKFPTGAFAVIDFATDDWRKAVPGTGRLDRFVSPRMLAADAE